MLARFRRSEVGATAIEFALVITPILTILLGIIDFSLVAWRASSLDQAASELHSAVRQDLVNSGNYRSMFCGAAGGMVDCGNSRLTLRVEPLGSMSAASLSNGYAVNDDEPFVIRAAYRQNFMTPFIDSLVTERLLETRLVLYGARD